MQNRKEFVLKRCAWYYDYKKLFCNHPGVNPSALIKSEQPIRCNGQIVNDSELGRYAKGLQEGGSPGARSIELCHKVREMSDVLQKEKQKICRYHFLETKTTISVITRL